MKIALKANNGKYVCAEGGGGIDGLKKPKKGQPKPVALRANRDDAGAWETFTVVRRDNGTVVLQTCGGYYVTAEGGGGGILSTNRREIGAWEELTMMDGGFQTSNGKWLAAEVLAKDPILVADRADRGPWETFDQVVMEADPVPEPGPGPVPEPGPVDPPVPVTGARKGIPRGQGRLVVDDGGAFNPVGASFFWLFWGWRHDRQRTKDNVMDLAREGCQALRALCEVGGGSWADRTVDPDWPDYTQVIQEAVDFCYDVAGMRVQLTIIGGGTGRAPEDVATKVAAAVKGREHKLLLHEGANEAFDNLDDAQLVKVCGVLAAAFPQMLRGASSGEGGALAVTQDYLARQLANCAMAHFDRTNNTVDNGWRQVRQPWDYRDLTVVASQNEPAGPQSSVATQDRAILIAMQRAVGILCGVVIYIYHAGPGVRGGGAQDLAMGRTANFADLVGFREHWKALRAVGALLPGDLANWQKFNGHWAGHPFPADTVWTDGYDHGVTRTYGAIQGNQFVALPHGVKQWVRCYALRDCQVTVHSPLDGSIIKQAQLRGGAVHQVSGSEEFHGDGEFLDLNGPERGGLEAYIVKGTFI